jgi:CO/xanthine dehydrogenase Mo-binding subunit
VVVINPGIVDGQLRGAIAQGIGGALLEELCWSEPGVLANGTLMDYLVPRAGDLPDPVLVHLDQPATTNPLGVKGAGEAGIFAVSAAVCAALEDALGCVAGDPILESPVPPAEIRRRAAATPVGAVAVAEPVAVAGSVAVAESHAVAGSGTAAGSVAAAPPGSLGAGVR